VVFVAEEMTGMFTMVITIIAEKEQQKWEQDILVIMIQIAVLGTEVEGMEVEMAVTKVVVAIIHLPKDIMI
jgi:hypothetical protein